jgi:hypothetical protein
MKRIMQNSVFTRLKGRTFLILSGVIVGWLILTIILSSLIGSWQDHDADLKSQITSSIDVTKTDDFKWQIKTDVGNMLAYGKVTIPDDQCARFDEMGTKACTASVTKTEQRYTMHEESYPCGTSKHPRTCTRVYWSWDDYDSWSKTAKKANLLGYELSYDYVHIHESSVSLSSIGINGCDEDSCPGGYHVRYVYEAAPSQYTGVAYLNADANGLSMFKSFSRDATITSVRDDASHTTIAPSIVFWIVEVIITGGLGYLGYYIFRNDYDDGNDSDF